MICEETHCFKFVLCKFSDLEAYIACIFIAGLLKSGVLTK